MPVELPKLTQHLGPVGLTGFADWESVAVATRWWNLNYLRHAILLAAWLASLRTFALFYQQRG